MLLNIKKYFKFSISLFLFFSIFLGTVNAKEQYSLDNIDRHLYEIFKREILYGNNNETSKYIPFSGYLNIYYEFSNSIKNQEEKIKILEEVIKKFEKIVNVKMQLKKGKPDSLFLEQNGKVEAKYKTPQAVFERSIYIDFLNKDEIILKLKNDPLYKKLMFSNKTENEQKAIINNVINYTKPISLDIRTAKNVKFEDLDAKLTTENNKVQNTQNIKAKLETLVIKNFHIEEITDDRDKYFKEFVTQVIYLSLLATKNRLIDKSEYVKPSIFNSKGDDFSNGDGISEFDWILLDEFYNNKNLKSGMLYPEIISLFLTKSIYLRMQKVDK